VKLAWRVAATALALAMAVLIAGYSAVVPAFEAPDEPGHFRYVQLLAAGRGLPVQGQAGDFDPEFSQPPLYYAAEALLVRLMPASGAPVPDWDHHNTYQNATAQGNVNLYSHPAAESFPWTGQILQLHAMRLLNLLFAAVTLLATYGIGLEVGLSRGLALTATGIMGLLPQFAFISGALNADNAITASAALALYLLLRWFNRPTGYGPATLLGLSTGAAMLSKISGLAVLILVLACMLWRAWRKRSGWLAGQALVAGGIGVALGGWWYLRNLIVFGDPLGWRPMLTAIGAMLRPRPLGPLEAAAVLVQQRSTAIGVFGWNNLRLPPAVYIAADVVAASALVGLLLLLHSHRGGRGILALWVVVFAASLVRWLEVNEDAAQWRLLFPAFPALVMLLTIGLSRVAGALTPMVPVALAGLSTASLLLVIGPAYTREPAYAGAIQHQLSARFGDRLELVGYDEPQPRSIPPGEPVALTLYWRALQPLEVDDIVDLAGLDADNQPGLKESSWPQQGRAPTSGWTPGEIVRDRHVLAGSSDLAPGVWNLLVDVFEPRPGAPRLAVSGGGTIVNVGRFLVAPGRPAAPEANREASFESNLALLNHGQSSASGRLQVRLEWLATGPITRDYTVFVHALDGGGKVVAQNDSQPGQGRFPTSLIPASTPIEDVHSLDVSGLSAGAYRLEVGLYDTQTGARLKLAGKDEDALLFPVTLG